MFQFLQLGGDVFFLISFYTLYGIRGINMSIKFYKGMKSFNVFTLAKYFNHLS